MLMASFTYKWEEDMSPLQMMMRHLSSGVAESSSTGNEEIIYISDDEEK
jgi:hypothetical protein